jgi:hypothetical protein
VFRVSDRSFSRHEPPFPASPSSVVLLGDTHALFLAARVPHLYCFASSTLVPAVTHVSGITVIRPDPTDAFRFLCLADGALVAVEFFDGRFFPKVLFDAPGTVTFIASTTLLVTFSSSGVVRGHRRGDFTGEYAFHHHARPGNTPFVDGSRYYEQSSDNLTGFDIEDCLLKQWRVVTVTRVFDSASEIIFQVPQFPTIVRVGTALCFDVRREFRWAHLAGECLCVWTQLAEPPTLFRLELDPRRSAVKWRDARDRAIAAVRAAAARGQAAHKRIVELAARFVATGNDRLTRLKEKVRAIEVNVEGLDRGMREQGIGSRALCLEEFAHQHEETCFRLSLKLRTDDLLLVCGEGRLLRALESNRVSEPTLLELAGRLADVIEEANAAAVPLIVPLLLHFDPESPTVQAAVQGIADRILSGAVDLFQSVTRESPLYHALRKLSHIALSFKTIE